VRGIQVERTEYLTSIILSRSAIIWTATYADKQADTNIDGNDDHVTNTDEIFFDDTIRGKQISTYTDANEVHVRLQRKRASYRKCSIRSCESTSSRIRRPIDENWTYWQLVHRVPGLQVRSGTLIHLIQHKTPMHSILHKAIIKYHANTHC